MLYRAALPLGLLAVISSLPFAASSYAQLPELPKRCSPPPTEVQSQVARSDAPQRRVIIERVIFDAPTHLPDSVIAQAVAKANDNHWSTENALWVDEFAEIGLRGAWQDRGYNHVQVAAEAQSIGGDSSEERFLVIAHVAEGLQYHLGNLQFVSVGPSEVPHLSESELRAVFPLREGELFNVSLIRQGIEELTKLYWAQGYLDFTATPKIKTDENLQRVSLVFDLDEQKQFRVGSFEIVGLDPSLEARLRSVIRPGEFYNPQVAYDFLKENQSLLPPDLPNLEQRRNVKTGIVDLMLDARSCPPLNSRETGWSQWVSATPLLSERR